MKGCNIATNIRKTIEIVNYTRRNNIPALIMILDYRKCFDMIEHRAIWGCLKYFDFGPKFIELIKLLFCDIELRVQNNFNFSGPQGSPIASALFLICGQVLHDLITNNNKIQGI